MQIKDKPEHDPVSDLYTVDAYLYWALTAAEEVVGKNGLTVILRQAGLEHLINNYPPNQLKMSSNLTFGDYAALSAGLLDFFGRAGKSMTLRIGRQSARYMVEQQGALFGTAAIMAADLAHTPASGPRVQACGDAHLSNFGAFATPERQLIFDVNDLDETLPAPWEWDVKRLAASVILAGRHIQLKPRESEAAAQAAARSYREHMAEYAFLKALEVWYDSIDIDDPEDLVLADWLLKRRAENA